MGGNVSEPAAAEADFAQAIRELLTAHGVELPAIPDTPGRRAYLKFLSSMGYGEEEVLPVIDRKRVTPEMHAATLSALLMAEKNSDPKLVQYVGWMAYNLVTGRDSSNLILDGIARKLSADLTAAGVNVPTFYAGIFPTNSVNAQCRIADGQYLVLLDTGCMEMAESLAIAFASKIEIDEKATEVARAIERYVRRGERIDPFALTPRGINWGTGLVPVLTTAFEEYILAHELGHLILGHVGVDRTRLHSPSFGRPFEVSEKSRFEELQADMWACRALIERAKHAADAKTGVLLAECAVTMGLGAGLMVEAAAKEFGISLSDDGHPRAADRLYMMQVAYELLGVHREAGMARHFMEIVKEVLAIHFPAVEPPPMLARDLNKQLVKVLDSLGIPYRHAPYIHDFV
jgi:hypothetical protein